MKKPPVKVAFRNTTPRRTEAQVERLRALQRDGSIIVHGKEGVTVFRPYGLPLSSWDGHRKHTASRT
jgi:hypothetical protein